jgi:hypothetical protein
MLAEPSDLDQGDGHGGLGRDCHGAAYRTRPCDAAAPASIAPSEAIVEFHVTATAMRNRLLLVGGADNLGDLPSIWGWKRNPPAPGRGPLRGVCLR